MSIFNVRDYRATLEEKALMANYRSVQKSSNITSQKFNKIIFENKNYPTIPVIFEDKDGFRKANPLSPGDKITVTVETKSDDYAFMTEQKFDGKALNLSKIDANGGAKADDFVFEVNGKVKYWAASLPWKCTTIARAGTGHFENKVIDADGINKSPTAHLKQSLQDQTLTIAFYAEDQSPVIHTIPADIPL